MTTADMFVKVSAKNCQCLLRNAHGEVLVRSIGRNDLDAIRKMRKLFDDMVDEIENKKFCNNMQKQYDSSVKEETNGNNQ